jgi:UDP-N-acetylmuramoyl-tripeptide--D-alanyl-D-alanine ligase
VVVEMGMRGLGQITHLASVAEPDVGVITNVHPVHLELLGSLENIARAKAELAVGVRPGGTAVVPVDCALLEPFLGECGCRIVRFDVGEASGADVRGWLEPSGDDGAYVLALRWPEGQTRVASGYLPDYAVENAVAAGAACYAAGLPVEQCAAGIADTTLSDGRGQILEVGDICVIDDTYNSNPAAGAAAVDRLVRLAAERKGRAVAVLGDMLELGPETERFHAELGATAARAGVSALWGVGPLSAATVGGFRLWWEQNGQRGQEWSGGHFQSSDEAGEVISCLRPGDVVLFKASRGVRLEKVVRKMVDEATADRLRGASPQVEVDCDGTWEERGC